jgi:hypothetical protein
MTNTTELPPLPKQVIQVPREPGKSWFEKELLKLLDERYCQGRVAGAKAMQEMAVDICRDQVYGTGEGYSRANTCATRIAAISPEDLKGQSKKSKKRLRQILIR